MTVKAWKGWNFGILSQTCKHFTCLYCILHLAFILNLNLWSATYLVIIIHVTSFVSNCYAVYTVWRIWQLEVKNHGHSGGSHGWNSALGRRPWVWAPGRGSLLQSPLSSCVVSKSLYMWNLVVIMVRVIIRFPPNARFRICRTPVPVCLGHPFMHLWTPVCAFVRCPYLYPCVRALGGNFIMTRTVYWHSGSFSLFDWYEAFNVEIFSRI